MLEPIFLQKLQRKFPDIAFVEGPVCMWSPAKRQVTYDSFDPNVAWDLLHECAHAVLDHQDFTKDIQLLQMETQAWHLANITLSKQFLVTIPTDYIDESIESYRAWLHSRSTCPQCSQTGVQINTNSYSCINCSCLWQVNSARQCALRRKIIRQQDQVDLFQQ
jgi:hypothetical protein